MAKKIKNVGIALQGGGAHGAFTWGVLDRLLEVEEIDESQVNANCKVVNLAGQVVKSVNLSSAISIFNIADLPSGILIFKLYDANLSYTKKVFLI